GSPPLPHPPLSRPTKRNPATTSTITSSTHTLRPRLDSRTRPILSRTGSPVTGNTCSIMPPSCPNTCSLSTTSTPSNWCLLQPNVAARVRLMRRQRVRTSGGTAMAEQLTTRQRRILEVIRDAVADRGCPPAIREIGDAVGLTSTSSVHCQLEAL